MTLTLEQQALLAALEVRLGPLMERWQRLSPERQKGALESIIGAFVNEAELTGLVLSAACDRALRMVDTLISREEATAPSAPAVEHGRITGERLKEIEARAAAASEGPWIAKMGYSGAERTLFLVRGDQFDGVLFGLGHDEAETTQHEADTTFIAHARQDVPDLVAEVRRLREALRPFIAHGVHIPEGQPDAHLISFTVGDVRRARAVLGGGASA